jgi:hypothetical protein
MQAIENDYNAYVKPHIYVFAACALGTYFLTPLVGPTVQSAIFNRFNLSPNVTSAVLSGVWAGSGVVLLQLQGYSV